MMRTDGVRRGVLLAWLAMGLLVSGACSGGNSDVFRGITASFQADNPSPAGGSVSLQEGTVDGDVIQLKVMVTGVTDLLGVAFHVTYDPAELVYLSVDDSNSLLNGATLDPSILVAPGNGELIVGATRLTPLELVDVTGPSELLSVTFRVRAATTGTRVEFTNGEVTVCDPASLSCGSLVVTWSGGTITAQ